jgi:hypothetical protein
MSAECCGSFTTAAVSSKTEGRTRLSAMLGLTVGSSLPEESVLAGSILFDLVRSGQVRSGQPEVYYSAEVEDHEGHATKPWPLKNYRLHCQWQPVIIMMMVPSWLLLVAL